MNPLDGPPPAREASRRAIQRARRRPEPDGVADLLALAEMAPSQQAEAGALARQLAGALRARSASRGNPVQGLLQEFSLSSEEGIALMCLAEALLRVPDAATRDALIRDKIGRGDWGAHVGRSASPFVNAAAWGLVVTGRLVATHDEAGLANILTRVTARLGEPVVRTAVDLAMRLMGRQFVAGETIEAALLHARRLEGAGFRYSYDMLGEAALTAEDAARYGLAYEEAIRAIGAAGANRGVYDGPGISIKLSALHPRYSHSQRERVMAELYPRVRDLAVLARRHALGLNIDAEEADRLELSLDLLEPLCADPALAGWDGLGFVVQAYQKRAPLVIDHLVALAGRHRRRLMVRLVKGAYWDSEIKRAQVEGLDDYPVFTRKAHTDLCYLACARKLLAAPDAVFPQFATHNAHTLAAVFHMAGAWRPGQYEFQCLHGMGEPLYELVVAKLGRPCRIYAPVGTHETLLAYLVRRLLENGANTSFIHRIADPEVSLDELTRHPAAIVRASAQAEGILGAPHPRIPLPEALYAPQRRNSRGWDFTDEQELARLAGALHGRVSAPAVADASPAGVEAALAAATEARAEWSEATPAERAAILDRAADLVESRGPELMALVVEEAGRTWQNAMGEVREAADFLRYYAAEARRRLPGRRPLGVLACISPWNFPLAIFTGQAGAALAAGNTVLAKPAEQTPRIAAAAVRLLHEAGVPRDALRLVPGPGESIGAALVADRRVQGVVFTGSTEAARLIQRSLARRLTPEGRLPVLVAETGGQNAMVVDSSALAEQVVADALVSAFDSAGQRCSSLRVLCLQEDVAPRIERMLEGALAELRVGDPARLDTDVGPVIDAEASRALLGYLDKMRAAGRRVHQAHRCEGSRFVPPTLVYLGGIGELGREVFGPVLHVLRYAREDLERLVDGINALGYGLTLGVHSRVDGTIARVLARARVGNAYVNRNMIGAVVGVQPFGGEGLSGTGPKAGGPLYLPRLTQDASSPLAAGEEVILPGPTGEQNAYSVLPRGTVLCLAGNAADLRAQVELVRGLGAYPLLAEGDEWLSPAFRFDAVLHHGGAAERLRVAGLLAEREGPVVPLHAYAPGERPRPPLGLLVERTVSINTAAAGGNASLMAIG